MKFKNRSAWSVLCSYFITIKARPLPRDNFLPSRKVNPMFKKGLAGLVLLVSISSGCSITDYRMTLKGNEYMSEGDYPRAESVFQEEVRKAPDSALAHYYLGRFQLAQDKAAEALPQFNRAVAIDSK
ncbi:MAG: tetratricopeptide repeat protein, partial [Desulfobulbaceae bacterium]|nr:tetratricopeptide repeat protein [Desulfobulbaceae bacterium]